jgi:hypothetical protein
MAISNRFVWSARRPKSVSKNSLERPDKPMRVVADKVQIDRKLTVRFQVNELAKLCRVGWTTRSGQRHDSSLFEASKSQILCDACVEHSQRVEEVALPQALESIAGTRIGGRGRLVAISVHDKYRCLLEWRDKKACCVGIVMPHLNNVWDRSVEPKLPFQSPPKSHWHVDNQRGLS